MAAPADVVVSAALYAEQAVAYLRGGEDARKGLAPVEKGAEYLRGYLERRRALRPTGAAS